METTIDNDLEQKASAVKERLGKVGRQLKNIDLRGRIIMHPFAAVGIAAAAGAVVGLVRPTPQRGRVKSALITMLGAITFRLLREAALRELGTYAKNYVRSHRGDVSTSSSNVPSAEGGGIRYTPSP